MDGIVGASPGFIVYPILDLIKAEMGERDEGKERNEEKEGEDEMLLLN